MIDREDLKRRVKHEENEIEKSSISLPEETVFAAVKRANMLLRNVRSSRMMNTAFMFKASEIAQNIQSSIKDLGIRSYVPEIDICKSKEKTAKSLSDYIQACIKAGQDIEKVKKDAGMKLNALANVVEEAINPDEQKVKTHVNKIISEMNRKIFK